MHTYLHNTCLGNFEVHPIRARGAASTRKSHTAKPAKECGIYDLKTLSSTKAWRQVLRIW
jgi:hypothetical protein